MAGGVEKLGDSYAGPAFALLAILSRHRWAVTVERGDGGGVLVSACHPGLGRVSKQGGSVASVAGDVVEACLALTAEGRLH